MLRVGFDEAVSRALAQHPAIRISEASVERARAVLGGTRAASMPTVHAAVTQLGLQAISVDGEGTRERLFSRQVALKFDIPVIAARAWADRQEQEEEVEVAEMGRDADDRNVALHAARAWADVVAQAHVLEARQEALHTAEAHLAFARGRTEGGLGTTLDTVRAEREVVTVRVLVEDAESNCTAARERLGVLMGYNVPVDADPARAGRLSQANGAADKQAFQQRPDLAHARVARTAAQTEVDNHYTEYLPELRVRTDVFYQNVPTPVLPLTGIGYAMQATLAMPLWDGGVRAARRGERRAKLAAAEARLDDVARTARAELRSTEARRGHALAAQRDAGAAARLAHEALSITRRRYAEGLGTDLDVIDSLREARDADIGVAVAEHRVYVATLEFLAAEGVLPKLPSRATKNSHAKSESHSHQIKAHTNETNGR